MIRGLTVFSSLMYSKLAMLLSVLIYTLTGNVINASYIFTIATFLRLLQTTTLYFPVGASNFAELLTSTKRIQQFLLYEDFVELKNSNYSNNKFNLSICLTKVTAKWFNSPTNIIQDINFKVQSGQLVAIIGSSGSGKSTLLNVILEEVIPKSGSVRTFGTISYASQEPWLFVGTLRQNILFGEPYNEKKYLEVVKVCALETDFELFPFGDGTLTGDRGCSLSGGQKSRINLARALYRDADIYLLDDPLSAVDNSVGKHIFESSIRSYLKHKTVILVTHQIQYLENLDHIYLLKDGCLKYFDSYSQWKDHTGQFIEDYYEFKKSNKVSENTYVANETIKIKDVEKQIQKLEKEDRSTGKISGRIYKMFLLSGGYWMKPLIVILFFILAQAAEIVFDYFVTFW